MDVNEMQLRWGFLSSLPCKSCLLHVRCMHDVSDPESASGGSPSAYLFQHYRGWLMGGGLWWCWKARGLSFACLGLLGLEYQGIGTLQKYLLLLLPFLAVKLNNRRRDLHMSVIALIKYPSLMPLYIYSVSLETHKASFSDLCDETSLHYLPGTFWRNKRPIE